MTVSRPVVFVALSLALGGGAGCSNVPTALMAGPQVAYARPYPDALAISDQVDIQARRKGTKLTLTNTTPTSFGPSTIWVNRKYSRPIPSLEVGETISVQMDEFVDEHNERFRQGGFFATRTPQEVMLTQLEATVGGEPTLIGLITVDDTEHP